MFSSKIKEEIEKRYDVLVWKIDIIEMCLGECFAVTLKVCFNKRRDDAEIHIRNVRSRDDLINRLDQYLIGRNQIELTDYETMC